jgi:hypothetical protein
MTEAMNQITAADPEARSADLVADNVARLKELFPEAFTEGKIDFDVLKQLLDGAVDERPEKYGLNWHGQAAGPADRADAQPGHAAAVPRGQRRLGHDAEPGHRGRQPGGAEAAPEELRGEGEADLH